MRTTLVLVAALSSCGLPTSPTPEDGGPPPADAGSGMSDGGSMGDAGAPACGSDVTLTEGMARTTSGAVSGVKQGDVYRYLGVPYAAPPVGALRWSPPMAAGCWQGVRPATSFGAVCPQRLGDGGVEGDEDCLTLNVYAPVGASGAPVMVWIHGGGNTQGSSSEAFYDGQELAARRGVVVVSINYRLGALGFFAHPALDRESDAGVSGNYGLLDQQLALRWVKDNARAFGGDPGRVMIFGESAGGQDTLLHLVSPGSAGLFHAAAAQSGGLYSTTLAEAQVSLQPVVTSTNCGSATDALACLRAVSATTLAAIDSADGPLARGMRYGPVIDGVVIPAHPLELIKQGRQHQVPVIVGSNAQETSRMVTPVTTAMEYQAAVRAQYGATIGTLLLNQYPASRFSSPREALVTLTTDTTWTCPTRRLARALASTQTAPVYRYFFSWRSPGVAGAILGATHGLEVPFVFRAFSTLPFTPSAADLALSESMQASWSQLASTGQVTGPVSWPRFPVGGDAALELNTTSMAVTGVRTADCDFMQQFE